MNLKTIRIILTAASGLGTVLWVSGMILANIYLVAAPFNAGSHYSRSLFQ
jgi:hypothetical protein